MKHENFSQISYQYFLGPLYIWKILMLKFPSSQKADSFETLGDVMKIHNFQNFILKNESNSN